ncbi:heparinase II/III domain-containing protein [Propioniciclava sinopodophylli]|nr:heparinase II/III family protein [Propioniciclava sinopodophylli]
MQQSGSDDGDHHLMTRITEELRQVVTRRLPRGDSASSAAKVKRFLQEGVIESPRNGDLDYSGGALWEATSDRSRDRFVHAFLWLTDWPATVQKDARAARAAFEQTMSWRRMAREWRDDAGSLAFHDETTAQRLIMHLAVMGGQREWLEHSQIVELQAFLDETAALLLDDTFHAGLNNHGMFQDIAVVDWAAMASWVDEDTRGRALEVAVGRLNAYFRHAFTAEGVHVEHAPSYHLMVVKQLSAHLEVLRAVDHPSLPEFERLLASTVAYATHAVTPQGSYPPISDTTVMPLAGQAGSLGDAEFDFAATAGRAGREPSARTMVLPESGYAIHRSAWADPDATFVYFSCAYNDAYHKHADENGLFLRHKGLDLISEAGPFGYNYEDPLTRYGYSQYAHSTLVVDRASIPRHGGPKTAVSMHAHAHSGPGFRVTGRNERMAGVVHDRTVQVTETDGLPRISVRDEIASGIRHHYELLWHVGPGLEVVLHGHGYELHREGVKVMDAFFSADVALRVSRRKGVGGRTPEAWRFPSMGQAEPSDVVVVEFEGESCSVATEIRLADFTYRDRKVGGRDGWLRSEGEVGLNYLRVAGRTRDKLVVAFTSLHQVGDFTYNYKPTLDAAQVEALYILDDFGDQGSYYLQDHGDRRIFRSVQALIRAVLKELALTPDDLVFVGSSKGATAALIHGMSIGAGSIFVGGPQTRIGSFLAKPHPNVLQFMTGGTSEEHVRALDAVTFDIARDTIDQWRDSTITVLVGDRDHHYKGHVLPFTEHVRGLGATIDLVTLPGHTHGTFGPAYRDALATYLSSTVAGTGSSSGRLVVSASAGPGEVVGLVLDGGWPQYAARLFRGPEQVAALSYGPRRPLTFTGLPAGRYRVRVFARSEAGQPAAAQTTGWVEVR